MGSLAQLAKAAGYRVSGCDANVYPPMSTQLEQAGIELIEGFDESQLALDPDVFVVGNVVSRGNELMEAILDRGLPFCSGPQWFSEHILAGRWVLGVAGTHGKTTTSSMLAWILEYAGYEPGYLIGGVPENFGVSARLGQSDFFVVEADEYDTAFFDKRSKFVHYMPRTLILNNLEFDHADIFDDLAAIQKQFHHLIRTVAQTGLVIFPSDSCALNEVIELGCWTEQQTSAITEGEASNDKSAADWQAVFTSEFENHFDVLMHGDRQAELKWSLTGKHNVQNALHAIAAARHVGVVPELAVEALMHFKGVKRRMEVVAECSGLTVYDDFAHHPTAIASTLEGLRRRVGKQPIIAVIEPRSNTMKMGVHKASLMQSVEMADQVHWYQDPGMSWSLAESLASDAGQLDGKANRSWIHESHDALLHQVVSSARSMDSSGGAHIVVMSNGGFGGMSRRLAEAFK